MLDSHAFLTTLEVGGDFSQEGGRNLSLCGKRLPQKAQHIRAGKCGHTVLHQARIDPFENRSLGKEQVGGPFTGMARPVIAGDKGGERLLQNGIEEGLEPVELLGPVRKQLRV